MKWIMRLSATNPLRFVSKGFPAPGRAVVVPLFWGKISI